MIISRTPLRIGLVGGGTDLKSFYERHGGAVVSMAINKYIFVSVNEKFDGRIRISYSRTENVSEASELRHDIARECLQMYGLKGVEITSVSDIPGAGSGLGSSSSFTVGLIKAIDAYIKCHRKSPHVLAEQAYMVELGCGHSCGKQDHYAAAYGGLHLFKFRKDGGVECNPIALEKNDKDALNSQLMLFWTGKTRKATKILKKQGENLAEKGVAEWSALAMRDLAYKLADDFESSRMYSLGERIKENWELKKQLASGISEPWIDRLHAKAMQAGAIGAKLCGAGGGGFFLVCAIDNHVSIENALGLRRVPILLEEKGSEVVYE